MLSKYVNNKKCAPKFVFFSEKKIRKIQMTFDIENWLWKSNSGTLWQLATTVNSWLKKVYFSFLKSRVVWFKTDLCSESKNRSSEKKCLMYVNLQPEIFLKSRVYCTPKKQRNVLQISALASKKWLNQKSFLFLIFFINPLLEVRAEIFKFFSCFFGGFEGKKNCC